MRLTANWNIRLILSCHTLHSKLQSHHLKLLAHSHLTEVDGEDGVRAGALSIHLGAGCGPGQSAELQTLQQLWGAVWIGQRKLWTQEGEGKITAELLVGYIIISTV